MSCRRPKRAFRKLTPLVHKGRRLEIDKAASFNEERKKERRRKKERKKEEERQKESIKKHHMPPFPFLAAFFLSRFISRSRLQHNQLTGLAGERLGQHRLAASGRAVQQYTLEERLQQEEIQSKKE